MEELFNYLIDLSFNNNKPWFEENKDRYLKLKEEFEQYIDFTIAQLSENDPEIVGQTGKKSLYRIYRDARFSKDKTPYKTNFGAEICRNGKSSPFAGYYIHVEPGNSFVGGGLYSPLPKALMAIRQSIAMHHEEFTAILNDKEFQTLFGGLWEMPNSKLKRPPKGFSEDSPLIEQLKNKRFVAGCNISDDDVLAPDFAKKVLRIFKAITKLNHFLNLAVEEVLEEE